MSFEVIFSIVTAVVTALLGVCFKNTVIPARFIPIQNLIIGIIAAIIAVILNIFDNNIIAILISFGMAFGAGGVYDLTQTKMKGGK